MPFEIVIITKTDASELDVRQFESGLLYPNDLVNENKSYILETIEKSAMSSAICSTGAKEVFRLWLDVLAELPMRQTLTLWSVVPDESGGLFMHTYVGQIDNARLPRACKIQGKG